MLPISSSPVWSNRRLAEDGDGDEETRVLLASKHEVGSNKNSSSKDLGHVELAATGRRILLDPSAAAEAAAEGLDQEEEEEIGSDGGLLGGVFNLATTIVGAGIMALPAATRVLGLPLGVATIAAMGALSELSLEMVVAFTAALAAASYGDMVAAALASPAARLLAQLAILLNNGGILIVYLIIVGDVVCGSQHHPGLLQQWTNSSSSSSSFFLHRPAVLLLINLFVLAPLCFLRRIDSLKFTSAASVALAVVFVFITSSIAIWKGVHGTLQKPRMLPSLASKSEVLELLTVVPIMTNAYICHFNIQPIYNELSEKSPCKMNKISRISTLLCTHVYIATAVSGYLLFGDATASDVLSNFDEELGVPHSQVWNALVRVGYVVHLLLVFPVVHFSLRQNVAEIIFGPDHAHAAPMIRHCVLTASLLLIVYLGSTLIPNIWIAFQFTGATAGLSLGFIFPAIVALKLGGVPRFLTWSMLLLAAIASALGLLANIYNVATNHID